VSYYKAQGKLRTVRGVGSIGDIFKNITDIVEAQIRPLAAVMGQTAKPKAVPVKPKAVPVKGAKGAPVKAAPAKLPPKKPEKKPAPKKAVPKKKPAPKKAAKPAKKKPTPKKPK